MVRIEHYLNDGADWQAQAVLAYLRTIGVCEIESAAYSLGLKDKPVFIEAGRFENCREQGYVVRLYVNYDVVSNYAFFEHRNSDDIVCFKSLTHSLNTPSIEEIYGERGKYDYDHCESYGKIVEMGDWIIDNMNADFVNYLKEHPIKKEENVD